MGFDDTSNSGLRLGLGLGPENCMKNESQKKKVENNPSKCNKAYPSLTLGPPDDDEEEEEANNQPSSKTESYEYLRPQVSSPSAVSSFSNSCSIKRERDQVLNEEFEVETEKVPTTRGGDVDEDGNPRKKLRLTKEQSAVLEENFRDHSSLNPKQKQELARKLNLRARQVEVWFQNRRARTKLKQTESDCELLKKYCETLTKENKRLEKELQELKTMQTTSAVPFYMQIPAATLTICTSCERICGGSSGGNSNGSSATTTSLIIDSKAHHHFYKNNYPFPHSSSAAC
ncbi:homeobox-leucine zipper protein HAT9-like [Gastrolobium bilobum]|uniref:homeobox-leucine zipper protein HAT9-like n=1 Tax=Gastrolobium bilobum TaxID=150636 RepID=UPI002AAF8D42|nr:homeobox-leucine zipper protein HAT9-like [Gastrolobium bilobum]